MYEVEHVLSPNGVDIYQAWLDTVRDKRSKARITTRVDRASVGHFGDVESVGEDIFEMKINFGPRFRVYYACRIARSFSCWAEVRKTSSKKTSTRPRPFGNLIR
ncbi:hypothetical protein N7650_02560 [Pseudomonas sp. GD04058]|nr:type II toxin-antitoxin system RelE/ParE family toxin [Pseudomonas sp. GD04058]MDG9881708.1 hypothetical protein [Pseudomonas sp. GD04058]